MGSENSTGRDHEAEDPIAFDEAWANSGMPESSLRRNVAPPRRLAPGSNVTGAPAGPRDWTPSVAPSRRGRALPALLVCLLAAAALAVFLLTYQDSGPSAPPIAGGTVVASGAPSAPDNEPRVEGLSPSTAVGSCFDLHGSINITASFVSCAARHQLQLVGIETATGVNDRFPANTYWDGPVRRRCVDDLVAYSHQTVHRWPPQLSETEFIPRREGWAQGDRTIYCAGRDHPRASGSLRHLRPYLGRHTPISNISSASTVRSTPTTTPAPRSSPRLSDAEADPTTVISGTLGLSQVGTEVCLTVTNTAGSATLEPLGNYSETWQITNGTPITARSGISVGQHPSQRNIVRHIGSAVTLTGSYATVTPESCGAIREFDFTGVH